MSGKNKPVKRRGSTGKTATGNAKGRFMKGNASGPGRGHRRGSALAAQPGTPRRDPSGGAIAYVELLDQLALAKAQLAGALAELSECRAGSVRQSREWALALRTLESYPAARAAVLAALWPMEEAERGGQPGQASADAGTARPGGDAVAGESADVPLPEEKREEPTVYDGARRRPVPPGWGGRIESGRPRQPGVDGIGDRYGDSGPLTSQD